MSDKKVVWALFDSGNGCYTQVANSDKFKDLIDCYAIGLDKENKNSHFLNCNLAYCPIDHKNNEMFKLLDTLPKPDLIIASPPCFTGDTLINTLDGYKAIEDVKIGEYVYTATNKIKKIVNKGAKVTTFNLDLKVHGLSDDIRTTENHPFKVSTKQKVWNNSKRRYDILLDSPKKKQAKDIDLKKDYLCIPINKENKNNYRLSLEECYLIGRYIADGWVVKQEKQKNTIVFALGKNKEEQLDFITEYNIKKKKEKTCLKVFIKDKRLYNIVIMCGKGAENKHIPDFLVNLPKKHLQYLYKGLMDGDGYLCSDSQYTTKLKGLNTCSKNLILSLQKVIHKLFRTHPTTTKIKRSTSIIEGRLVNSKDLYLMRWKEIRAKQDKYYCDDEYIYVKVKKKTFVSKKRLVWNIEVSEEHTYQVYNVGVYNCESWSSASSMDSGNACWKTLCAKDFLGNDDKNNKITTFGIRKSSDFDDLQYFPERQFYTRVNGELCIYNTIEIIRRYAPKVYIIENPAFNRIWEYIYTIIEFEIPFNNLTTYNAYGFEYKKPTKFKSNIPLGLYSEQNNPGVNMLNICSGYNNRSNIPIPLIEQIFEKVLEHLKVDD